MKPIKIMICLWVGVTLIFSLGGVVLGNDGLAITPQDLKELSVQARRLTVYELGEQKDPRAIPVLISSLEDNDAHVRRIAARALGKSGSPEGVLPLLDLLCQADQPFHVQSTAVWALGRIGDPRAGRVLEHMAEHERGILRQQARESLARLKVQIRMGKWNPVEAD